jgi:uncharacterized membrane protein YedE/YeeE
VVVKGLALAVLAGALFALGLALGGMTIPARVTGFLAIGGAWDPGLAFVMIGAIAVHAPLLWLIRWRRAPLLAERFHWPTATAIDARLVAGSAIFGVGWGLSGYCPGPALVSLAAGGAPVAVFVAAMLAGVALGRRLARVPG